jgi:hypothetical protein
MLTDPPVIEHMQRVCVECNRLLDNSEFVTRNSLKCNACIRRLKAWEAEQQVEELKQVLANTTLRAMAADRKGVAINAPHISEAIALGIQKLGGLDGFMEMYTSALKASYDEDPGSRKTLDHLRKFTDLITASTEHRSTAPDVEGMTDEEILAEYKVLAKQAMLGDSDMLSALLRAARETSPGLLEHDGG